MTSTPKSSCDDILGESWVELSGSQPLQLQMPQCGSGVGIGAAEEYIRLLREAQRESNNSSARVSLASSRHLTPRGSPKSPPNSPNTELSAQDDLPGVFINYSGSGKDVEIEKPATDWIWDWSSRPDQLPPKDWKFKHPKRKTYSIRQTKLGKNSLFSKEVLYTVFITNVITLLLGTGVGMWLSRRGFFLPRINID